MFHVLKHWETLQKINYFLINGVDTGRNCLVRLGYMGRQCAIVAWKIWKTNFNTILDKHAPIRHKRVKKCSVPWLNSNIKQLMQNRDFNS